MPLKVLVAFCHAKVKYFRGGFAAIKCRLNLSEFSCFAVFCHDCLQRWLSCVTVPGPCDPEDLIDGIIFAANYLGSTHLLSDKTPSKNVRMMQAQEAVSRIKVSRNSCCFFVWLLYDCGYELFQVRLSVVSEWKGSHLSFCKINCIFNAAFGTRQIRGCYQAILSPFGNISTTYTKAESEVNGWSYYLGEQVKKITS